MAAVDPVDPVDELYDLTRALRRNLVRHAAGGAWAVQGQAMARPAARDDAHDHDQEPAHEHASVQARAQAPAGGKLQVIREEVGDCTRCKLHSTRHSIVFGVGDPEAPLMFVGEGPGEQEDLRGEPFVGRAGELLDKMIEAMGWTRQSVYINNIVMCRPPGNRNPQPDEVAACKPFLEARIRAVAPRIIVALGRPAANTLLGVDAPIGALRGKFHDRNGVKVMPTFHPAYLLREPDKKREAWADLKLVMAELQRLGIQPPRG